MQKAQSLRLSFTTYKTDDYFPDLKRVQLRVLMRCTLLGNGLETNNLSEYSLLWVNGWIITNIFIDQLILHSDWG